jgi:SAM-dependent methyltransferase
MCSLCNSTSHSIIGKPQIDDKVKDLIRKDYHIVQCNNCGFYYVDPLIDLSAEEWKILYDKEYFGEYTKWHLKRRERDRVQRINKLRKFTRDKVEKFLDVGCGEGYMLLEAQKKGWKAIGLDITDNRIDEAKTDNITFIRSDLLSAEFPADEFDCIYLDSVVEHVLNPMEHLTELKRILRPGGIAYIGIPNEDCLQNDVRKIFYKLNGRADLASKIKPFSSPYHVGGFNEASLQYAIKNSSLSIKELRNFATRAVFLTSKFPSFQFFENFALSLIYVIAMIIRREYYFEVYVQKV